MAAVSYTHQMCIRDSDGAKRDVLEAAALSELFGVPVEVLERAGYYHVL